MSLGSRNNLLIVANFPSDTGYAWKTIGEYFLVLSKAVIERGSKAIICYPQVNGIPQLFRSSGIQIEAFDFFNSSLHSIYTFIKNHQIDILYVTDRALFSMKYIVSRLAGVRRIILHDRTSGHRDVPGFIKRWAKKALTSHTFTSVDLGIAISNYVIKRMLEVYCVPKSRAVRVYNGLNLEKFKPGFDDFVFSNFNIPANKKIVFAHARANKYKGIQTLIEAADLLIHEMNLQEVVFLYCGDGPDLGHFRSLVAEKNLADSFLCPGKSDDIQRIIKGASVVVVPSIWQEGLGLSVLEGMATGKPMVATRVGGIVEIIHDTKDGFLFEPGDSGALADILLNLLQDDDLRAQIGSAARNTMVQHWNIEDKKKELVAVFKERVLSK